MSHIVKAAVLVAGIAMLSGCVVAPPPGPPGGPGCPPGTHWVHGFYGYWGVWHPGHCARY